MAAWLYKSNQKVHSLVHYLISCVPCWLVDWLAGGLLNWLVRCTNNWFVSCLLCCSLICSVLCVWLFICLFWLIALLFFQRDLLQVSGKRNSSRPSWSKWALSHSGRSLDHCIRDNPRYGIPLVQTNYSQRNFYPFNNHCEKCRGIKFTFDVNCPLFPSQFFSTLSFTSSAVFVYLIFSFHLKS